VIRPYEPADREAVRDICYVTGYMGEPIEWQWRDRESFADLFSGYYTDAEPESALVIDTDGKVTGYLLGCVDSTRAWDPARVMARHLLRRGVAFRPGTAGVMWRSLVDVAGDAVRHRLAPRAVHDDRWPAHLHIDLLPEARGRGAGAALVHTWLDSLRARGVPGCHLETMAENTHAIGFFEAMGFERRGEPAVVPGLRSRAGDRLHVQLMVMHLH